MVLEVCLKGTEDWKPVQVLGKRRGFVRVEFRDGKSKWLNLKDTKVRGDDPAYTPETAKPSAVASGESVVTPEEVYEKRIAGETPESTIDPETAQQLSEMTRTFNYQQQAAFFLNAYWREYGEEAEQYWTWSLRFIDLDDKGKNGFALDEVKARQFLQEIGMPMARQAYLDAMRQIDVNNDRKMSFLEFLMFSKGVTPMDLLAKPQDGMTDELEKAYQGKETALQALADLEAEKAELEEIASGSGVKAMQARTQLPNFKKRDFDDAAHNIKRAERAITKAKKSPELREKGTEFFEARGGEHAKPKKAAKAHTMIDGGSASNTTSLHENVQELWQEELVLVIRSYNHKQQAGYFLNAYWEDVGETAEVLWDYALAMGEIDTMQGENGSYLDEGQAIKFFRENVEDFEETATAFRKKLREQICLNNDKKMGLVEFLLFQFELDVEDLMTRPQGGQTDIIRSTTRKLKEIKDDIQKWEDKVAAVETMAAGSGVKASGAKNQLAQGYGRNEIDDLKRKQVTEGKKRKKAENSEDMTEPGFLWIMERQNQWNIENPQRRGYN